MLLFRLLLTTTAGGDLDTTARHAGADDFHPLSRIFGRAPTPKVRGRSEMASPFGINTTG